MNRFEYSPKDFFFSILMPILIIAGIFVWALLDTAENGFVPLNRLIFIVMPVLLATTVIGINTPSKVILTEETISFSLFGITHAYKWNDITILQLKRYDYVGKVYIRIGTPRLLGGRYWLMNNLSNYPDLLDFLEEKSPFYPNTNPIQVKSFKRKVKLDEK